MEKAIGEDDAWAILIVATNDSRAAHSRKFGGHSIRRIMAVLRRDGAPPIPRALDRENRGAVILMHETVVSSTGGTDDSAARASERVRPMPFN